MTEPTTLIQGPLEGRSVLYQVSLAAHAGSSAILTPKAVASIYEEIHAKFAAINETIRHGQEANVSALEGLKDARDGLTMLRGLILVERIKSRRTIAVCGWVILALFVANVIGWGGWLL